jgi:homoserine O-acetyltransferase/O-succinyltransferase
MRTPQYAHNEINRGQHPADAPDSAGWTRAASIRLAAETAPFALELGGGVGPIDVEYETCGALSPKRDNAILIAHALSGDAHAAGWDPDAAKNGRPWRADKPGWWDAVIGPGKPIDTSRFFVICANVLGGCYGTTGPCSTDPRTGKPYGQRFPMVTVGDWVRLQAKLLDALGIERLHCVTGGSLGGQQAIEWALAYPERVDRVVAFAAGPRLSAQGLAYNAVGRHCIMNDPNFRDGDYYGGPAPSAGLAAARMLAHITYLSDSIMHEKFGRRSPGEKGPGAGFGIEFEVEKYLDHQGRAFVERFDANSYLYITRAMDYYDAAAAWGGGNLEAACGRIRSRVMVVSFESDWLYPPEQSKEFAHALTRCGKPVTYANVPSRYGHDSFLVETGPVGHLLRNFLNGNKDSFRLWRSAADAPAADPPRNGCDPFSFNTARDGTAHEKQPRAAAANGGNPPRWQDVIIENEIPDGASVLDLGCGDGHLLAGLALSRGLRGQGVELDPQQVFNCVRRGVPVLQEDIDAGLAGFADKSFDYVVLEETLQTVYRPVEVLNEMLRIGRYGIVSFPNFANYRLVYDLFSRGRMPVASRLPHQWYETPNIHLFTLGDFLDWAAAHGVTIIRGYAYADGHARELRDGDNMYAEEALVVVRRTGARDIDYCI